MKKLQESETMELKSSTSEIKEAVISIASILNKHKKGELYFGIKNDGTALGQHISEKTLREISQKISENIEPKIYPHINKKTISSKNCIQVKFAGSDIPYFAFGRAYIRVADEDRKLGVSELKTLILQKNKSLWEEEISSRTFKDIKIKTVKEFIKKANAARRINFKYSSAKAILQKLELTKGSRLLKAAEVLFCDKNSFEIQAAVFAGKDKLTFLDINLFKGNLFDLLDRSETYIKEHINWRAKLTESGRKEIPEIPLRAITEALVNSLCHRDFTNPKGNEIAIFEDRVEIYNPGRFPDNYSPEDFKKGTERSILRNPLIANIFYLRSDIEKWGSGIKRIYDACKEAKIKVEFKPLKTGFLVTFYRPLSWGVEKGVEKGVENLSANELKIYELIKQNPNISKVEITKQGKLSKKAVDYNIEKLKEKGILKRIGPDKGGYWKINE